MKGRSSDTVVWRGQCIPSDVARALRDALVNAKMPPPYVSEDAGQAWEAFKRAYVALTKVDPSVVIPPGTTFPNAITKATRTRATDMLAIYLGANLESRVQLFKGLQLAAAQVLEDATLRALLDQLQGVEVGPAEEDEAPPSARRKARKKAR